MKILLLGDVHHPNTQNWIYAFRHYGQCEIVTWALPKPESGRAGRMKRIFSWFMAIWKLRKYVRDNSPDVLIGYRLTSYGFLAASTGFNPLVIAAQGETDVWPQGHWTTPFKAMLAKYAIKRADVIHAWEMHMAKSIYALGAPKEKVLILPRGIDLRNFTFSFTNTPHEEMTIVVTRGLAPEYNHITIFKAVMELQKLGIPFQLVVAGDGAYKPILEQFVATHELQKKIKFLGRVNNNQLRDLLRQGMVYVSMPDTEGVSASLLEAMACYCVPVVSDIPANRFWIEDGKNGFLIPLADYQKLASVLSEIWHNRIKFESLLLANRSLVEAKASMENNTKVFIERYKDTIRCAG